MQRLHHWQLLQLQQPNASCSCQASGDMNLLIQTGGAKVKHFVCVPIDHGRDKIGSIEKQDVVLSSKLDESETKCVKGRYVTANVFNMRFML